jgi:endo-1,4-beta-xylanase
MARSLLLAAALLVASASARHPTDAELLSLYGPPDYASLPPLRYRTRGVDANQTLRAAAAARNVFIGFAAARAHLTNVSDPDFASVGQTQFDLTTAENECKWGGTEGQAEGVYTLDDCAFVTNWTLTNMTGAARGHNLAWGTDNPGWLTGGKFSPTQLMQIWTDHATHMFDAFGPSWVGVDVINEPVCDDPNCPTDGSVLKPYPPWYPAVPDFIEQALTISKQMVTGYGGKTVLFINDYGGEGLGGKSDRIYSLAQGLLAKKVPLEGIGLQMHISVDGFPSPADVAANIKRLGELGLQVHITEMDVRCSGCTPARLDLQAQIYGGMMEACLNNTGVCTNFETWGT